MITNSLILLAVIGLIAAVLLFLAAKKFFVYEDPKIGQIEEILPGANCGGCGFSGCHAFAVECASASSLDGLNCTSLDKAGMGKIAEITGLSAVPSIRKVAFIKCNATCSDREPVNHYDGVKSCAIEHSLYQGESDCIYGCLGCGDCVRACPFEAMSLNEETFLPIIDHEKCVGCGKCVEACPRSLCQLIPVVEGKQLVVVRCANKDKGPVAIKECSVSCIGCGKCIKVCPVKAPSVSSFLAHIDPEKCTGCGECIPACPRNSIKTI